MRYALGWLVLGALCVASTGAGADGAPSAAEIDALIRDLGASRYADRERATRRLWEIGTPARAALTRAVASEDPEVSTRAERILADVAAGIRPDWPAEVIATARGYRALSASKRNAALDQLCAKLKGKALGFVLWRLAAGASTDAPHALACLQKLAEADATVYRAVLRRLTQPANEYEGQAVALARLATGSPTAALKLLTQHKVGSSQRREIITKGVANLLAMLEACEFRKAADEAGQFADAAPTDARFLYLQAEALAALEQDAEANRLRAKALALHADKESPHYTAGDLLQRKLGRRELAAAEWRKILAIAPEAGVYDMNALLRLHSLCAETGRYAQAAGHLDRAVVLIEDAKRKRGSGVGIVGGTPESLRARAASLRARARGRPAPPPNTPLPDRRSDTKLHLSIRATVKDGKLTELRRALGQAAARATVNIQPRGLRLFDKNVLSVRYDAGKGELGVYLNNSPCAKPTPLALGPGAGKPATVAIRSLDCFYIYQVDPAGGPAKKLARYEFDYRLVFCPGNKIAAGRDLRATLNGKAHAWEALLAGVPMDYLPPKLHVTLRGVRPSGKPLSLDLKITPKEPDIQPLRPAPATRPKRQ